MSALWFVVASLLSGPAAAGIEVIVTKADGTVVPNTAVQAANVDSELWEEDPDWEIAPTDAEGRVRFETLDPGRAVQIVVFHDDPRGGLAQTVPPGASQPIWVRLPQPPWALVDVFGRVLTPEGEPVAGARVRMSRALEHAGLPMGARTDAEGGFTIANVKEDAYRVEITAPGWHRTVERAAVTRGMGPLQLRLRPTVRVYGEILGAANLDLSGAHVSATTVSTDPYEEDSGPDPCRDSIPSLGPDGFGEFVVGQRYGRSYELRLPLGRWKLQASKASYGVAERWVAETEIRLETAEPELRIDLQAYVPCPEDERYTGTRLAGRVYDEATGEPVAAAAVRASCRQAITGADGTFDLGVYVHPSECDLGWVRRGRLTVKPRESWMESEVPYPEPDTAWIEIPVHRTVGFCYEVRWANGEPFRGWVHIYEKGGEQRIARSDADGNGAGCVAEIAAGDFEISTLPDWRNERLSFSVPTDKLVLVLPMLGGIRIHAPELTLGLGRGWLEGVAVRLEPLAGSSDLPILRDELRSLWIGGVPPGRWLVTVEAADGRTWRGEAEVRAQGGTTVVVR
jgi:hypothetical protein